LVYLLKNIVISDDQEHYSHLLVPRLAQALSSDQRIKPPHEVLRNYDYNEMNNLYSNLSEWKTLDINFETNNLSAKTQGTIFTLNISLAYFRDFMVFYRMQKITRGVISG
jgi:hypothetical protein